MRKSIVVPPHTEMAIPVHNFCLPESRDFLFEPEDSELAMYAHLIESPTSSVLIRNDRNLPIKIPRNYRLGKATEIDFPNAFQVEADDDVRQLVSATLDANDASGEDAAKLPFHEEGDGLIFHSNGIITDDHAYEPRRLCIPHPVIQDILQLTYDEIDHAGFARCYEQICSSWYIRGLSRYLRDYLRHCPRCHAYQTIRHATYGSLQPILTPPIPFHTITIDFILGLPTSTASLYLIVASMRQ